ncbi:MAG: hypothetical protein PSX80_08820, partial [bacterium]|nr:hypothetical protein [bacterium]
MKSTLCSLFVSFIIIVSFSAAASSQTVEVLNAQAQINRVLEESGKHFKSGLEDLRFNRRQNSGEKFDKSVETFLLSTLNIQRDPKLQACYSQLVETIYRMEYPVDNQAPQLRPLAVTCGWNWSEADGKMADEVATLLRPTKRAATDAATIASIVPGNEQNVQELNGFNNQVFEPSPLDELSKLELTADELQVEGNPEAQQQYQYIQYAVANRSLGFSFQVHPMIQQYINYYRGRGRKT